MGLGIQTFVYGQNSFSDLSRRDASINRPLENINDVNAQPVRKTNDYASDANIVQDDVASRQVSARREALNSIMDIFSDDLGMDGNMIDMRHGEADFSLKIDNALSQRNKILDLKKELQKSMGVADDSKQQKDLELIEKKRSYTAAGRAGELSDDEKDRLANMGPLSDYQKRALEYDDIANYWGKVAKNAINEKDNIIEKVSSKSSRPLENINDIPETIAPKKEDIRSLISAENMAAVRRTANNMVANNKITAEDVKGIKMDQTI